MNSIEVIVEIEGRDPLTVALEAEATVEALMQKIDPHGHETLLIFLEGQEAPLERHHHLHRVGIHHGHHVKGRRREVEITINGTEYRVRPGEYTVAQLKDVPKPPIPADETLSIMVEGEAKPLDQNKPICIKGGEIFASNTPSGGGS